MQNPGVRSEDKQDTSLGLKTKLRLEIVIPLLTAVASFTLIYGKLIGIENNQRRAWTIQHQIMWVQQMQLDNPTVKVPSAEKTVGMMNQTAVP